MPHTSPESIKAAAIMWDGALYTGVNHMLALRQLEKEHPDWRGKESVQGFLTSDDRFVTRQEAGEIAEKAEQLKHLSGAEQTDATSRLDSDHLWH